MGDTFPCRHEGPPLRPMTTDERMRHKRLMREIMTIATSKKEWKVNVP